MPLEFALRPRIRLREGFAPPKRRWRLRLPRFTAHVLAYWALIAGICYAVVRAHDSGRGDPVTEQPLAAEPPTPPLLARAGPEPTEVAQVSAPSAELAPATAVEPRTEAVSPVAETPPSDERPAPEEAALEPPVAAAAPSAAAERSMLGSGRARSQERVDSALPSCESAAASAVQDLDFASSDRTADLPSSAIAGVLENGAWLSSCNVPASTHLGVCVAIKHGQVTAATVIARPADAALEACVKTRAAALQFPYSNRQDIARTQF